MSYQPKTNWQLDDIVMPDDMNRIESGIVDLENNIGNIESIKVLEASEDNVIDFNTLTETGIYLIKNVSNGITAENSPYINVNFTTDIILEVNKVYNVDGTLYSIYQRARRNTIYNYLRVKTISTNTWDEWTDKMSAGVINVGKFANGMSCNTPTSDAHLANKAYVDGKTWSASAVMAGTLGGKVLANATAVATLTNSQIRNIKASTTDLTAGTSALTTGDIVLIYE